MKKREESPKPMEKQGGQDPRLKAGECGQTPELKDRRVLNPMVVGEERAGDLKLAEERMVFATMLMVEQQSRLNPWLTEEGMESPQPRERVWDPKPVTEDCTGATMLREKKSAQNPRQTGVENTRELKLREERVTVRQRVQVEECIPNGKWGARDTSGLRWYDSTLGELYATFSEMKVRMQV